MGDFNTEQNAKNIRILNLRVIVTVILVIMVIGLDVLNINPFGMDMEKVFLLIGKNTIVK